MNRGVKINGTDSYEEYGLQLLAGVTIESPKLKEVRKDIPGANGSLNLSYALANRPTYTDRGINFELFKAVKDAELTAVRSALMAKYHGREVEIIFPFDKSHYYAGVLHIGNASGYNTGKIPVNMTVFPYKYNNWTSLSDWIWDDFSFSGDVARDYGNLPVENKSTYLIIGSSLPVVPTFIASSDDSKGIAVKIAGFTAELNDGENIIPGLVLESGEYNLELTGNGTVSVSFRGGEL